MTNAHDGQIFRTQVREQDWLISWHPPGNQPTGTPHGSAGICFTPEQTVVIVSASNGEIWEFPGGRPEVGESLRETLIREIREEACADVTDAALLGFVHGKCIKGSEAGRSIVRAAWTASVKLCQWSPRHEMTDRTLVEPTIAIDTIEIAPGTRPVFDRWMTEALAWW